MKAQGFAWPKRGLAKDLLAKIVKPHFFFVSFYVDGCADFEMRNIGVHRVLN